MDKRGIRDQNWSVQYLNAYYFSTVTMITVGYGDIVPNCTFEMIYCILTMLMACGVYAYSLNAIGTIF